MEKLIISAAICGAEVTKEQNPAVPYTVEEIAREAKSAYDAGASVIHLHVRWDDGTPTQDKGRFQECVDAIRALCPEAIIQPSTGGAVGMSWSACSLQRSNRRRNLLHWIAVRATLVEMRSLSIRIIPS